MRPPQRFALLLPGAEGLCVIVYLSRSLGWGVRGTELGRASAPSGLS